MLDLFAYLSNHWLTILNIATAVIAGASIAVRAIAPHTRTVADDDASSWLLKVETWLSKLALNPSRKDAIK